MARYTTPYAIQQNRKRANAFYWANREEVLREAKERHKRTYVRKRPIRTPEERLAIQQKHREEWAKRNPEKVQAYRQKYYKINKEQARLYNAKRYIRNQTSINERNKAYYYANKPVARKHWAMRRARTKNIAIGNLQVIAEWEKKWRTKVKVTCYWCKRSVPVKRCHVDHITPVAKGGSHAVENLCLSCAPCNRRKHVKDVPEWNRQLSEPVLELN